MLKKTKFTVIILLAGMVIILAPAQSTYSQVAFGVRYHHGPITLSFGNYPCYPYGYYPAGGYVYLHPRHHRYYHHYYEHNRGYHRGWFKREHRRHHRD